MKPIAVVTLNMITISVTVTKTRGSSAENLELDDGSLSIGPCLPDPPRKGKDKLEVRSTKSEGRRAKDKEQRTKLLADEFRADELYMAS
jgi:hypothetical protein